MRDLLVLEKITMERHSGPGHAVGHAWLGPYAVLWTIEPGRQGRYHIEFHNPDKQRQPHLARLAQANAEAVLAELMSTLQSRYPYLFPVPTP